MYALLSAALRSAHLPHWPPAVTACLLVIVGLPVMDFVRRWWRDHYRVTAAKARALLCALLTAAVTWLMRRFRELDQGSQGDGRQDEDR